MGDDNDAAELSRAWWQQRFSRGQSLDRDREALGRLVDYDCDDAEVDYYEWASDPVSLALDRAMRRRAGQRRRQIRRIGTRGRDRMNNSLDPG
jgi:hypothetical protein